MKTWKAILLTVGIFVGCACLDIFVGINLLIPIIVGTSVWAGLDSAKIHLKKYLSGISYGPIILGIVCSMFWPFAFPWYLSLRYKIMNGKARLRPEYEPWDMASGQMSSKGLVQPWQGKKI